MSEQLLSMYWQVPKVISVELSDISIDCIIVHVYKHTNQYCRVPLSLPLPNLGRLDFVILVMLLEPDFVHVFCMFKLLGEGELLFLYITVLKSPLSEH